jgi:type I restriction enzyme S subunit
MKEWRTVPLGEVVTFQRGFDLPQSARIPGDVPLVSSAGVIDYLDTAIVNPPGVVTGRYGTVGKLFFITEPFWPLNTTLYVRDFHGNDERFVYYLLQRFDFASFSGKSGVPGVNRNDLHAEPVFLPVEITEQRAIAAALSDVDALLAALDRLLAKKRAVKQAAMQQLLTGQTRLPGFEEKPGYKQTEVGLIPEDWDVVALDGLANITAGGTPSRTNPYYWNGDIPWVTTSEIDFNTITSASQFITREGLDNSSAKLLQPGTLLLALYGQGKTRGKVGILGIEAATNQACAAISLKQDVSQDFIFRFLASQYDAIRNLSNTGNQENLNSSLIRSISIILPPLPEQTAIAAVLSDMDAELSALARRRAKMRDVKQAMMQELLTGRTRLV